MEASEPFPGSMMTPTVFLSAWNGISSAASVTHPWSSVWSFMKCLLSGPKLGFFLHLLLRNPPAGMGNTLFTLPLITLVNSNNTFTWSGPSGVLGCTGQRPGGPAARGCMRSTHSSDGCHAVPLNAAESPGGENLRGGKRLRLRFWKGFVEEHAYPFALSRPLVASLQLCSLLVFGFALGVRPLPR
jgi:hypothetical protein